MTETTDIELPDDVSASVDHLDLTIEGPNGAVTRRLWYPDITVTITDGEEGDVVRIENSATDAKTLATVGTFESHVQNIIHGVTEGWEYEMEVFYSHFPMQVNVDGGEIIITNFLGETASRRTDIRGETDVEINDEEITLSGPDIEDVGQTAADIEQLTRVKDKDPRVFQDGVYITQKPNRGEV